MLKLRDGIVELYNKVATSIPPDVEEAIKAITADKGDQSAGSLPKILTTIKTARQAPRPACIDTGIPIFKVSIPKGLSHSALRDIIKEATAEATKKIPLSPNAVDILSGMNSGDNTGIGFPVVYFDEARDDTLTVDLMLRAGDCEDHSKTYKLPVKELGAGRDIDGIRKCVLDCVKAMAGKGCPPYTIGVGVGATMDQVSVLAVHQLFRKIPDKSEHPAIAKLELEISDELNRSDVAGGKTMVIGVKIGINHRHPESFLVHIAVSCWANRRGRLIW